MKSWCDQIIGGEEDVCITIGKSIIDTVLLWFGEIWWTYITKDFVIFGKTDKVKGTYVEFESTTKGDKGILAATIFFMYLQLHSINGKSIAPDCKVVCLWCSILWLTFICGTSIITKRNVVSAVISLVFLFICPDVQQSWFCTSRPIE